MATALPMLWASSKAITPSKSGPSHSTICCRRPIVGSGNMRMQDLADSMGTGILGTAKTFGVSLQDVGAALATLTDAGVPAVDAATRLSHTFVMMGAPTEIGRASCRERV